MTPIDIGTPQAALNADEARWLAYWRQMDDRRRQENLAFVAMQAAKYPRRKSPRLRLVTQDG
jgi:hypothetical protein